MTAPDPREIQLPGDPPSGRGRRAAPLALAAAGLLLALVGTLPAQSWTLPTLRLPDAVYAALDWAFLAALLAATLIALAVAALVIWAVRRPLPGGARKLLRGNLSGRDLLLLAVVTALGAALALAVLRLDGLDHGLLFQLWSRPDAADETAAAEAQAASLAWGWTSATAEWLFGLIAPVLGIVLVVVGLVCFAVMAVARRTQARAEAEDAETDGPLADALAAAAAESLDELDLGVAPRRAINACYARFEAGLAAADAARTPFQTPLEVMRAALAKLPLDPADVGRLTALFERARFSDHPMGEAERAAAIDALAAIGRALAGRGTDAPAR